MRQVHTMPKLHAQPMFSLIAIIFTSICLFRKGEEYKNHFSVLFLMERLLMGRKLGKGALEMAQHLKPFFIQA